MRDTAPPEEMTRGSFAVLWRFLPMLWPKGETELRVRVVVSLILVLAGKAIDLGDPSHPRLTIFTSRDGKFGAQGLRPGRWRVEMPTEPPLAYEFDVADSVEGIVRIGDLQPAIGGIK